MRPLASSSQYAASGCWPALRIAVYRFHEAASTIEFGCAALSASPTVDTRSCSGDPPAAPVPTTLWVADAPAATIEPVLRSSHRSPTMPLVDGDQPDTIRAWACAVLLLAYG